MRSRVRVVCIPLIRPPPPTRASKRPRARNADILRGVTNETGTQTHACLHDAVVRRAEIARS
eukprot:3301370-Lingulodinium_polyedra.AAC.1